MKRIFSILAALSLMANVFAQAPEKMSYQAVIRNSSNALIVNQQIGMRISILQGSANGTAVYVETQTPTTNENGLVSIEIGGGTVVSGNFTSIDWANGPYFIKTETDLNGGTNYTITGNSQLLSVPYAFYAKTAGSAQGGQTVIQNDSLVLKDANGVTRMVLNPNTGTFKMMNNDTIWYQMTVNSPVYHMTDLSDESFMLTKVENGMRISEIYQNGNLIAKSSESEKYDGSLVQTTQYSKQELFGPNPSTGVYEKVKEVEMNSISSCTSNKYNYDKSNEKFYNNGNLYSETITESKYEESSPGNVSYNYEITHYKFYDNQGNIKYEEKVEKDFKNNVYKRYCKKDNDWILMEENNDPTAGKYSTTVTSSSYSTSTTINQSPTVIEYSHSDPNAKKVEYTYNSSDLTTALNFLDNLGNRKNIAKYNSYGDIIYGNNNAITTTSSGSTYLKNTYSYGNFYTTGNATVEGSLNVMGTKNFRITHPNDTNKYLVHAAIESNEVLNQYSGNVITDGQGYATVTLPDYFDQINKDFRYVLTVVGQTFAQAIVYQEIDYHNQFVIKTNEPNIKVSWQVIAKRNDAYMQSHPFQDVINKN